MAFDPTGMDYNLIIRQTLYWFGIIFMWLVGIGIVIAFWLLTKFNIPTHIYEVIGENKLLRLLKKTRSMISLKDNVSKLRVFGLKEKLTPPRDSEYILGKKGKLLNLIKTGEGIKPFTMTVNPGYVNINENDARFWRSQSIGESLKKYTEQSFMQKYGAYMVFVFGLLVLGWLYYIQLQFVQGNIDKTIHVGQSVAEALKGAAP